MSEHCRPKKGIIDPAKIEIDNAENTSMVVQCNDSESMDKCSSIKATLPDSVENVLGGVRDYDFLFENLVFEGGGVKMAGHVGVIKVLEDIGAMKRCKRFAGTSGGAIVAALLSVGMTSDQMITAFECNLRHTFVDATFGRLSFFPNMFRKFGWNPGKRFLSYVNKLLKEQTGQEHITFKEVYDRYGTELCIVATNVSTMSVEYFHPKTTPDVDIAVAVKCSAALPGYVQPVKIVYDGDLTQYFMDGCLTCNFPLHVFDGWYLSMEFEDSFFYKLGKDKNRFTKFNPKTLGCILMAAGEGDLLQGRLLTRNTKLTKQRPATKMAKKNAEKCAAFEEAQIRKQKVLEAGGRFLDILRSVDINRDSVISFQEFQQAFDKLSPEDVETIFGKDFTLDNAFKAVDKGGDQEITMEDFFYFMQKRGIRFRSMLEGGNMMTFTSAGEFFGTAYNTLMNTTRLTYYKEEDINRTIGIDTDYIQTTDFDLEKEDKEFLIQQGMMAAAIYLHDLVEQKKCGELPSGYDEVILEKDGSFH